MAEQKKGRQESKRKTLKTILGSAGADIANNAQWDQAAAQQGDDQLLAKLEVAPLHASFPWLRRRATVPGQRV